MPSTRERTDPSTGTTTAVMPEAAYERARQVGGHVPSDTASRPPATETVSASRTTGWVTVRLIPVPARKLNRGTAG
jgi:hypothetical protein